MCSLYDLPKLTENLYVKDDKQYNVLKMDKRYFNTGLYPIHKLVFIPFLLEQYLSSSPYVDVNILTNRKHSALYIALSNKIVKSIKILIDNRADITSDELIIVGHHIDATYEDKYNTNDIIFPLFLSNIKRDIKTKNDMKLKLSFKKYILKRLKESNNQLEMLQ